MTEPFRISFLFPVVLVSLDAKYSYVSALNQSFGKWSAFLYLNN